MNRVTEKDTCHFCNAVEDEVRIIGSFVVKLKEMNHKGDVVLACQSCIRKTVNYDNRGKVNSLKKRFNLFGFRK